MVDLDGYEVGGFGQGLVLFEAEKERLKGIFAETRSLKDGKEWNRVLLYLNA
jgi:hypothetical protein